MRINASRITAVDADSIPTGELLDITGTVLDFTAGKKIGHDIEADDEQIAFVQGYDHNYVIDGAFENGTVSRELRDVAEASSDVTGIVMTVRTDMPGVQLYTGNYLGEGHPTKSGSIPARRSAFCLETQFFPDAPHHKNFTSTFFKAGETFESVTEYTFSVSA
jgi:aldose 1-epimerase